MILFGLSSPVCDVIRPRPFEPSPAWAAANIVLPKGSEIRGRFRLDLFPHSIAVLEAFDDPAVGEISLQWASRLGKTVIAQACCAKVGATNPNPMAWADADQKSTERVLKRLWQILERVPALVERCPPRHQRAAEKIEFPDFLIHGAWSGSASSAADYAAFLVVLNEIDKMTRKKSDEADFAELMTERAKGFLRSKVLRMSTPSYKGRSRIEDARIAGDNRQRYVPCPKCNHWQTLRTGVGQGLGGLKWDKPPSGKSDRALARETAWYECEACARKILDHERFALLNAGVWVPEGQTVTGSGKLKGRPLRSGRHASFGPLSTLYSLLPSITWGVIADKFLDSRATREKRRNYVNSWDALTWDEAPQKIGHELLALRLCAATARGVCPDGSVFLTRGVDVLGDGHTYRWTVWAWGRHGRGHLVDWGTTATDDAFAQRLTNDRYPHADQGRPLRPGLTLIDSGDGEHTNEVYRFCQRFPDVFPCKGATASNFPTAFRLAGLSDGQDARARDLRLRLGGHALVIINTERSQWWVENFLAGEGDSPQAAISLAADAAEDPLLFDELTNEYADELQTKDGYEYHTWKKRGPNELRDASRYAWVAAQYQTNHGQLWPTLSRQPAPAAARRGPEPLITPDGRPFLVTER